MCKCISELEKKVAENGFDGKRIEKAKFISSAFMMPKLNRQASGEVEVEFEGGKRPKKINIMYSYCPFCGEEYPE